ncbi:dephospho-CoA kinase [Planctomycetota bacterium]|nr:dephospho-CoA kinase [Planctomycetota bacterium]
MSKKLEKIDWKYAKPVIGMMGAPGSGKSLVARQFEALGCYVIDADKLAKEAINQLEVQEELRKWWGEDVIGEDGLIDRVVVAKQVFENKANLERLEGLVHPVVGRLRSEEREKAFSDPEVKAVVEDCPLLIEVGLDEECDVLVYIDVPWEIRLKRVAETRGWDEAELRKREKNQALLDTKRQRADYVVSNDSDLAHCEGQVRGIASLIFPV